MSGKAVGGWPAITKPLDQLDPGRGWAIILTMKSVFASVFARRSSRRISSVLAGAFVVLPGLASADCPALADRSAETGAIYTQLSISRGPTEAQVLSALLWSIWTAAPDAAAQDMLDRGMAARIAGDLAGSVSLLGELIAYCPAYAEGWNQRAFAAFLARDYAAALDDLDRALAIEPRHLGALTGRAMTYLGLERETEAERDLRAALRLNPWLAERALLERMAGTDL